MRLRGFLVLVIAGSWSACSIAAGAGLDDPAVAGACYLIAGVLAVVAVSGAVWMLPKWDQPCPECHGSGQKALPFGQAEPCVRCQSARSAPPSTCKGCGGLGTIRYVSGGTVGWDVPCGCRPSSR